MNSTGRWVKVNNEEKFQIISITIIIILIVGYVIVGVTYPKTPEEGTITYRGWTIYQPDQNATRATYVATHVGYSPITDQELIKVINGIDEAMP